MYTNQCLNSDSETLSYLNVLSKVDLTILSFSPKYFHSLPTIFILGIPVYSPKMDTFGRLTGSCGIGIRSGESRDREDETVCRRLGLGLSVRSFFSSCDLCAGLTTRLPPNIESRSSARDCKICTRCKFCKPWTIILNVARPPRHSLVRSISTRLSQISPVPFHFVYSYWRPKTLVLLSPHMVMDQTLGTMPDAFNV